MQQAQAATPKPKDGTNVKQQHKSFTTFAEELAMGQSLCAEGYNAHWWKAKI